MKVDRHKAAYEAAVSNGKKGGAPKGNQNARKTTENNQEKEKEKEKEINIAPSGAECDSEEVKKNAVKKYSTGFEEFWGAYPRKTDKSAAYKCYNARLKDGWSPEELLEAARNYAAEAARRHTEPQYIKHAKTFLSADTPFTDFLPKRGALEQQRFDEEDPFADWRR